MSKPQGLSRLFLSGLFIATWAVASPAFAKSDADFISEAIRDDSSQIAVAKLAQQRASNGAVRSLANELVLGPARQKAEASRLAESLRAHVPTSGQDETGEELKKLSGLSGNAFDKAFIDYTIADHKRRIDRFESQSKDKSAATATFAEKTLPALRDRLRHAQSLSKSF